MKNLESRLLKDKNSAKKSDKALTTKQLYDLLMNG
jgi:hypothetical protein